MQKVSRGVVPVPWCAIGTGMAAQVPVVLAMLLVTHAVLWTLVPALTHVGLPLDLVEGYAIAPHWVMGTAKHPALPSWLLEVSYRLTGAIGWPAYLLSALSIVATYAFVHALGRATLNPDDALAGTLLLSGVLYFSWVSPEFNHNVAQMPFWMGAIFALWRARESNRAGWWALFGAMGAIGLYAKLSMALLLIVAAAYILFDPRGRGLLATRPPWIGLTVFLILAAPLLNWLLVSGFQPLEYAATRSAGRRSGHAGLFLLKQVSSAAGLFLILGLAWLKWPSRNYGATLAGWVGVAPRHDDEAIYRQGVAEDAWRFLLTFFAGPLALVFSYGIITSGGVKGSWGTAMLSLTGLLAMATLRRRGVAVSLDRIIAGTALLLVLTPCCYGLWVTATDHFSSRGQRVNLPQVELVRRAERIWRERTGGQPLRIVAGDLWTAGIVAVHGYGRPALLPDGQLGSAPWIAADDLLKYGALVIWSRSRENPPASLASLIGRRIDGTFDIAPARGAKRKLPVYFAIIAPGSGGPRPSPAERTEAAPEQPARRSAP